VSGAAGEFRGFGDEGLIFVAPVDDDFLFIHSMSSSLYRKEKRKAASKGGCRLDSPPYKTRRLKPTLEAEARATPEGHDGEE
jgi:hypothetical protein